MCTLNVEKGMKLVMIIEYEEKYAEEVKDLFVELQEHIVNIDKEK